MFQDNGIFPRGRGRRVLPDGRACQDRLRLPGVGEVTGLYLYAGSMNDWIRDPARPWRRLVGCLREGVVVGRELQPDRASGAADADAPSRQETMTRAVCPWQAALRCPTIGGRHRRGGPRSRRREAAMTTEESASTRRSPRSSDRPEPIPVPEFGHIPAEGLRNTRDLGGMPTADRRTIAPAKLLRSGALHKASEQGFGAARGRLRPRRRHRLPHPARARQRSPTLASLWRAWSSTTSRRCPARPSASPTVPAWPRPSPAAGPHELVCGMYPPDPAGRGGAGRLRSSRCFWKATAYLYPRAKDRAGLGAVIVERRSACQAYVRADYLATEPVRPNRAEGISTPSASCGLRAGSMRTSTRCSTPTTTTTTAPWRR